MDIDFGWVHADATDPIGRLRAGRCDRAPPRCSASSRHRVWRRNASTREGRLRQSEAACRHPRPFRARAAATRLRSSAPTTARATPSSARTGGRGSPRRAADTLLELGCERRLARRPAQPREPGRAAEPRPARSPGRRPVPCAPVHLLARDRRRLMPCAIAACVPSPRRRTIERWMPRIWARWLSSSWAGAWPAPRGAGRPAPSPPDGSRRRRALAPGGELAGDRARARGRADRSGEPLPGGLGIPLVGRALEPPTFLEGPLEPARGASAAVAVRRPARAGGPRPRPRS